MFSSVADKVLASAGGCYPTAVPLTKLRVARPCAGEQHACQKIRVFNAHRAVHHTSQGSSKLLDLCRPQAVTTVPDKHSLCATLLLAIPNLAPLEPR